MLTFSRLILEKVSFDRALFRKELLKAIRSLKRKEQFFLIGWCMASYGHKYSDVILEAMESIV